MNHVARRRYLTNFDTHRLPHLFTDVLVIGSGVAGLRAALAAAEAGADVLLITKADCQTSSTSWAQGGIAAVLDSADSTAAHAADTLACACELADPARVATLVQAGAAQIAELQDWGARFDMRDGHIAAGREGAHSASRIVHAQGDATGRELSRVLAGQAGKNPRIRIFEHCFAIDILTRDSAAVGAVTWHARHGHQLIWSSATVLASGGVGRIFRETTNPLVSTGDGLAMALRAGARLRDPEMVQFHPTTLYIAGAARALISEAVRGEGGRLVNRAGQRFMARYDERGELASRDIVSRAILSEMRSEGGTHVFLDVRHFPPGRFVERFPNIAELCRDFDIDPQHDLIPVRPSAHYGIGGVVAEADTSTDIAGLFACGEVASAGIHGANRLASNSLLEGLVFGGQAGRSAAACAGPHGSSPRPAPLSHHLPDSPRTALDLDDVRHSLQSVMSRNVGIERSGDRLTETIEIIDFWARYVLDKVFDAPTAWETQNMLTVAQAITLAAATRCESRGVHFRSDHPEPREAWRCHIDIRRAEDQLQVGREPV